MMEFDRTLSGSTPASEAAVATMLGSQTDFDLSLLGCSPLGDGLDDMGLGMDDAWMGVDPDDTDPALAACNPFLGSANGVDSGDSLAAVLDRAVETVAPPEALTHGSSFASYGDGTDADMFPLPPSSDEHTLAPTSAPSPAVVSSGGGAAAAAPAVSAVPGPVVHTNGARTPRAAAAGVRAATQAVAQSSSGIPATERRRVKVRARRSAAAVAAAAAVGATAPAKAGSAGEAKAERKRAPKRRSNAAGRPSRCPNPEHADGCTNGPHCKCPAFPPYCTHGPGGCVSTQNVKWRKFCNACLAGKRNSKKHGLQPTTSRQAKPANSDVAHINKKRALPSAGRPSTCPNPAHAAGCTNGAHCKCPSFTRCSHGPGGCVSTQNVKWRKFCNSCLASKRHDKRLAAQAAAMAAGTRYVSPVYTPSDGLTPGGRVANLASPTPHALMVERPAYPGSMDGLTAYGDETDGRGGGVYRGNPFTEPDAGNRYSRNSADLVLTRGEGGSGSGRGSGKWYNAGVDVAANGPPSSGLSLEQLEEIALTGLGSPVDGHDLAADFQPLVALMDDSGVGDHRTTLADGLDFVWSEQDKIHESGDSKVSEGGAGTDSSASGDNASSNDGDGAGGGSDADGAGDGASDDGAGDGAGAAAAAASEAPPAPPFPGRTHSVDPSLPPPSATAPAGRPPSVRTASGKDGASPPATRPPSVHTPPAQTSLRSLPPATNGSTRSAAVFSENLTKSDEDRTSTSTQGAMVLAELTAEAERGQRRLSRSDKPNDGQPMPVVVTGTAVEDASADNKTPRVASTPSTPTPAMDVAVKVQPDAGPSINGPGPEPADTLPDCSLAAAYLMWPLGFLGLHHFYLRRPAMGVLYMFTLGLLGMGWLSDLVRMPSLVRHANRTREQRAAAAEVSTAIAVTDVRLVTMGGGFLGLHHFYLRRVEWGLLYLCTFGLFGVGWLVDIFRSSALHKEARARLASEAEFSTRDTRVLALCLGWMGAHHFYLRNYGWGVLYALTFGLGGMGWLVDVARAPTLVRAAFVQNCRGPRPRTGLSSTHMLEHTAANTLLLSVTTGMVGGHYFYLKRWGWGVLYACTAGLFGVGYLFDMFRARELVLSCRALEAPVSPGGTRIPRPYLYPDSVILATALGWVGAHHYYHRRWGWGLLYTFTFGVLGFGWLWDCITMRGLVSRVNDENAAKAVNTAASPKYTPQATARLMPLGFLGLHHFYLNRPFWGLLYLFSFGVLGVGWLVDCFRVPSLVRQVNHFESQSRFTHPPIVLSEAYILGGPLGFLGLHHFYMRRPYTGVLYLCTLGVLGLGWISDFIRMPYLVAAERKRQAEDARQRGGSMTHTLVSSASDVTTEFHVRRSSSGRGSSGRGDAARSSRATVAGASTTTGQRGADAGRPPVHMRACCICLDEPVDTAILPCGHSVLCMTCGVAMQKGGIAVCPICREPITEVKQLIFA